VQARNRQAVAAELLETPDLIAGRDHVTDGDRRPDRLVGGPHVSRADHDDASAGQASPEGDLA
jgi:hypothetical protein